MANLYAFLDDAADRFPDRSAVRMDDLELSYAEPRAAVRRARTLLAEAGVEPGDRVGVMLPNVPAFPIAFYGVLAADGIVVPMNPLLKSREVAYLGDSGGYNIYPRHIWLVDALPKGPAGKILRREVAIPEGAQ